MALYVTLIAFLITSISLILFSFNLVICMNVVSPQTTSSSAVMFLKRYSKSSDSIVQYIIQLTIYDWHFTVTVNNTRITCIYFTSFDTFNYLSTFVDYFVFISIRKVFVVSNFRCLEYF